MSHVITTIDPESEYDDINPSQSPLGSDSSPHDARNTEADQSHETSDGVMRIEITTFEVRGLPLSKIIKCDRPALPGSPKEFLVIVVRLSGENLKKTDWTYYVKRAKEVLKSFLNCHPEHNPRKVRLLIRTDRPSYVSIDDEDKEDMKILFGLLKGFPFDKMSTIAIAGMDSFTANVRSLCGFFAPLISEIIEVTIATDHGWQKYSMGILLDTGEGIKTEDLISSTAESCV